ncbi:hypothetical protein [Arsenicicoccus dermatophilus]|uniref:hypothetical protein n=1 Tax=Arsenicicoccus dermatophilus TaxID=1076331 RepID=UPI0039171B1D
MGGSSTALDEDDGDRSALPVGPWCDVAEGLAVVASGRAVGRGRDVVPVGLGRGGGGDVGLGVGGSVGRGWGVVGRGVEVGGAGVGRVGVGVGLGGLGVVVGRVRVGVGAGLGTGVGVSPEGMVIVGCGLTTGATGPDTTGTRRSTVTPDEATAGADPTATTAPRPTADRVTNLRPGAERDGW